MKKLTITQLVRTYKTAFLRIPEEGMLLTKNNKPLALIKRVDKDFKQKIREKVIAEAKESIRRIKLDTFNEVEIDQVETVLGMCDRCGTQGEVRRGGFLSHGKISGKWLCVKNCWRRSRMEKDRITQTTDKIEMTFPHGDFGRTNEERTF